MKTLDASDPLVLDTKPLGRRAGAMLTVRRSLRAPAGWSVSSSEVVAGSPVELDLRMESVVEGVLVSGSATVETAAECSRCLDPVTGSIVVALQQLFEYPDLATPPGADGDPLPQLVGDLLDLEPVLRDGVVLDLPQVPVCTPDCPGLCPVCGLRLADEPGHRHDRPDTRWAELQHWLPGTTGAVSTASGHDSNEKGK